MNLIFLENSFRLKELAVKWCFLKKTFGRMTFQSNDSMTFSQIIIFNSTDISVEWCCVQLVFGQMNFLSTLNSVKQPEFCFDFLLKIWWNELSVKRLSVKKWSGEMASCQLTIWSNFFGKINQNCTYIKQISKFEGPCHKVCNVRRKYTYI
jgi:hypothetical protein